MKTTKEDISEGMSNTSKRLQKVAETLLIMDTQKEKEWVLWNIRNTRSWLTETEEKMKHLSTKE